MRQSLLNETSTIVHFPRWSLSQLFFYWRISDSPDKGRGGEEFDNNKKESFFFPPRDQSGAKCFEVYAKFLLRTFHNTKRITWRSGDHEIGRAASNELSSLARIFFPLQLRRSQLGGFKPFPGQPLQMCAITYSILSFTRSVYPWELRCSSKNNNVVCGWSLKCHRSRGRVWWWERCDGGPKTAGRPNCTDVVCRYILQGWDTSARWGLKFQYRWRWDG